MYLDPEPSKDTQEESENEDRQITNAIEVMNHEEIPQINDKEIETAPVHLTAESKNISILPQLKKYNLITPELLHMTQSKLI